MRSEIVKVGANILKTPTNPVVTIDRNLIKLTQKMFVLMKKAGGLGLAANQAGYSKRLFVFGDNEVLINPALVSGDTPVSGVEGCLSIPGRQFTVVRYKNVVVTGLDLEGNSKEWKTSDLLARLFQHEIDHLNGRLIIDYPVAEKGEHVATL